MFVSFYYVSYFRVLFKIYFKITLAKGNVSTADENRVDHLLLCLKYNPEFIQEVAIKRALELEEVGVYLVR